MELYLKITAGLLLLVQTFNLASLQHSTNSPRHTIDKSWLRELHKNKSGSQNTVVPGEGREHDQKADAAKVLSNDDHSGIPSGSMAIFTEEEDNVAQQNAGENEGSDEMNDITEPPDLLNATTKAPESPDANTSPTNATKVPTNSSQANITDTEDELMNSTAIPQTSTIDLSAQNSTSSFLDYLDSPTTLAPVSNDTQESTIEPTEDTRSENSTESTNTSMTTSEIPKSTSTSLSTVVSTSTITEIRPETTTPTELNTPEMVNKTGKGSATGGGSERGPEVDSHSQSNRSWGAVLGTLVVVGFVALVAYIILKNKNQKGFSHRKLVEEYPSDPVLRLENNEPLDLNFGRVAYYNPGMQGDNIQMTNFPGRH